MEFMVNKNEKKVDVKICIHLSPNSLFIFFRNATPRGIIHLKLILHKIKSKKSQILQGLSTEMKNGLVRGIKTTHK